ncbi:MAG: NAD(P)-dependent oxidoreductase [Marinifilaceae bacterium]
MNIVFLEPLALSETNAEALKKSLKEKGHNFISYNNRIEDEDTLIERAKNADIIALSNIKLSKRVIDACPNLKMISVAFTGVDHIDMDTCREKNIVVSNAAGFSNESVAELAIGMMISTLRKFAWGEDATRTGGSRGSFLGTELNGKTVGIIGCGTIGKRVADICKVFGCKILAYNRNPKAIEGVTFTDKESLLKKSDIITLHTPLTSETKDIINFEDFDKMKKTAILINTARGPVVNKEALYDALINGKISGAATDVYDIEPPLNNKEILLKAPNLLMLPHVAYATNESFEKRLQIVIDNILLWLDGKARNLMN